jgi:putative phosphoribosyl transferase
MRIFRDRQDAGMQLALALQGYAERPDVIVLALPRGGVVVGYQVATQLELPLDVLVVRKLGAPGRSELAMGAIASGGVQVVDPQIIEALGVTPDELRAVVEQEVVELARRETLFRGRRELVDLHERTVVLVDDGLATGATMRAAIQALRQHEPAEVIVAVPVASPEAVAIISPLVDDVVCLATPVYMSAIGLWYREFEQTSDSEVRALLDAADDQALARARAAHVEEGTAAHP